MVLYVSPPPQGHMGVSPDGFALMTHLLSALAGGRLLLALEVRPYRGYRGHWGGYKGVGAICRCWGGP